MSNEMCIKNNHHGGVFTFYTHFMYYFKLLFY